MKPFLGIDITEDKKNERYNGDEFIVAKPSEANSAALESAMDNAIGLIEKSQLPLPIRIGHWICGAVGVLIAVGILRAMTDEDSVTLAQGYQNAPWLFWVGGICLVIWGILKLISLKIQKNVQDSDESDHVTSKLETITGNIFAELGVPQDASAVDVLSFKYQLKDGQPVAKATGLDPSAYINPEYKAFVRDGQLFLANLEEKFGFYLSEMKAIRTVKKSISVPSWNKDVPPNKGIYKPYKISVNDSEMIHFKPYHILELEHGGVLWGIYFPSYELPTFEKLTGLRAEQ